MIRSTPDAQGRMAKIREVREALEGHGTADLVLMHTKAVTMSKTATKGNREAIEQTCKMIRHALRNRGEGTLADELRDSWYDEGGK